MPGKVWDEITYPILNINGATHTLSGMWLLIDDGIEVKPC